MCCGFFFSSRRRHTRYWRDWSSDVCSSDLVDQATGEIEQLYSTDNLPDGVVHTRCNNRRASRCEPCSRLYQGDAWQLILAGLTGGKDVADTVKNHPMLFVTLTAPSFGPVHTRATDASGRVTPCRARRDK